MGSIRKLCYRKIYTSRRKNKTKNVLIQKMKPKFKWRIIKETNHELTGIKMKNQFFPYKIHFRSLFTVGRQMCLKNSIYIYIYN